MYKCNKDCCPTIDISSYTRNGKSFRDTDLCLYCYKNHRTVNCQMFACMSSLQRLKVIEHKNACVNCLSQMHQVNDCRSTMRCHVRSPKTRMPCKGKHHIFLHGSVLPNYSHVPQTLNDTHVNRLQDYKNIDLYSHCNHCHSKCPNIFSNKDVPLKVKVESANSLVYKKYVPTSTYKIKRDVNNPSNPSRILPQNIPYKPLIVFKPYTALRFPFR